MDENKAVPTGELKNDTKPQTKKRTVKSVQQKIHGLEAVIQKKKDEIAVLQADIKELEMKIAIIRDKENAKELAALNEYLTKNNKSPKELLLQLIEEDKEDSTNAT